ncbi:MAG: CapA family protein [Cyanobacteria bacterium P01_H01_bin.153]
MVPVSPKSVDAASEWPDCPVITDYLNTTISLNPPLWVRGQLPRLHIYLSAFHLRSIGILLPQLEQALRSLSGPKYWDAYVYVDEGGTTHRLIHHTLIEQTLSPTAPPDLFSLTTLSTAAFEPASDVTIARKAAVSRIGRSLGQVRPPTARRQRQIVSAIALIGASFVVGSLAAGGWNWGRSVLTAAETSSRQSVSPTTVALEPAIDPAAIAPLAVAADAAGETAAANLPPLPEDSLIEPIAPLGGLTVAAGSLVPPAPQVAVQIKAMGDIIPGTDFPNYRLPNDPNYLFNSVKMFMGEVDIVFGNFESTLTDYPDTAKNVGQGMTFAFRTPPNWTDVLKSAGFDVLSVANNHSFDFGDPGFDDTIANIEQSGMRAVGRKDQIVTVDANGYQVAFIGFSYWPDHNDMNNLAAATALVQQAQAAADMVVISVHAGAEGTNALRVRNQTEYFFSENRGNMVQFSHAMIDAGADLVLGHGPHVPRAVELYQNKLIAYSLGNFLGYRTLSTAGPLGLSMILQVDLSETGDFVQGRVIPVVLDRHGVPYIDDAFATVTLVRQLTAQDFPETPLTIDQMGYILRTDLP